MKINTRDFGWNDIDDEFFLLDSNLGKYYWLNRTAKDIWDILMESECENGDFEEVKKKIVKELYERYNQLEEKIEEDVNKFLIQFVNIGLIEIK